MPKVDYNEYEDFDAPRVTKIPSKKKMRTEDDSSKKKTNRKDQRAPWKEYQSSSEAAATREK